MSKLIPVTNNTANAIPVGSGYVMPGETRHFPEHQVPAHLRPADEAAPEPQIEGTRSIEEMASGTVQEIAGKIPDLNDYELELLRTIEEERDKPRQGVLNAIAEEDLKRADAKADSSGDDAEHTEDGADPDGDNS